MDEEAVRLLGALFRDNSAIPHAVAAIRPEQLRLPADRRVFETIADVYAADLPVDLISTYVHLRDGGQLDAIGGPPYLADLWEQAGSEDELPELIRRIADRQ